MLNLLDYLSATKQICVQADVNGLRGHAKDKLRTSMENIYSLPYQVPISLSFKLIIIKAPIIT